jgi:hypothetical protein
MKHILTIFIFGLLLSSAASSQGAVINVSGATAPPSSDASSGNTIYQFAAGTYEFTVDRFDVGDVLGFPADAGVTVINTCSPEPCSAGADGGVLVSVGLPGDQSILVALTGISLEQDREIHGLEAFKSVFGQDSITSGVVYSSLPGDCNNSDSVSIAEVQSAINMFLGILSPEVCVDTSSPPDGVSIAEVQKVINSFLGL